MWLWFIIWYLQATLTPHWIQSSMQWQIGTYIMMISWGIFHLLFWLKGSSGCDAIIFRDFKMAFIGILKKIFCCCCPVFINHILHSLYSHILGDEGHMYYLGVSPTPFLKEKSAKQLLTGTRSYKWVHLSYIVILRINLSYEMDS